MKIFGLTNFQTIFKKTCTNNPTSEIQTAPFLYQNIVSKDMNKSMVVTLFQKLQFQR